MPRLRADSSLKRVYLYLLPKFYYITNINSL